MDDFGGVEVGVRGQRSSSWHTRRTRAPSPTISTDRLPNSTHTETQPPPHSHTHQLRTKTNTNERKGKETRAATLSGPRLLPSAPAHRSDDPPNLPAYCCPAQLRGPVKESEQRGKTREGGIEGSAQRRVRKVGGREFGMVGDGRRFFEPRERTKFLGRVGEEGREEGREVWSSEGSG